MNRASVLKNIKLELIKEKEYLDLLKYHNSLNALKYFSYVLLLYILLFLVDKYIIVFIPEFFYYIYFSGSLILLTILCHFGYFENKLIDSLVFKNNCNNLEDFYTFIKKKSGVYK